MKGGGGVETVRVSSEKRRPGRPPHRSRRGSWVPAGRQPASRSTRFIAGFLAAASPSAFEKRANPEYDAGQSGQVIGLLTCIWVEIDSPDLGREATADHGEHGVRERNHALEPPLDAREQRPAGRGARDGRAHGGPLRHVGSCPLARLFWSTSQTGGFGVPPRP